MWFFHKPTKQFWNGDPSECPFPEGPDRIDYPKGYYPHGLAELPPEYLVVDGGTVREVNAEERAAADAAIALAQLPERKAERLARLEVEREAAERAGVPVGNVTLASSEYDQRRLATFLVGINEAIGLVGLGLYSSETEIAITDASDRDVPMTVRQFKMLAVAYMAGCQKQRAEYRAKRAAIQAATTVEELAMIH